MTKEEAIKILKDFHDESALFSVRTALETLYPELKESEGEKVRKALVEMVRDRTGDELWEDYNVHKEEVLAWLEKQGEQKPIEWDADDDDKFFFLKARLKDYEDCIIYDEELSMCQKNDVRETTKEFLEWLDTIKERIGGE
jgi:hypothetical protein